MTPCDEILDLVQDTGATLSEELTAHVAGCPACREAVERARGLAEGARVLSGVRAPAPLVTRLKHMTRLRPDCERSVELLNEALDAQLDEESRHELMTHLHGCASCRATWEAVATLREVGRATRPTARLRADLRLHPTRRIVLRQRSRRAFDLRLATAAAYLIAALTIMLVGNPAGIARASSVGVEKASLYTRAAVENRFSALVRKGTDVLAGATGWAKDEATGVWDDVKQLVRGKNPEQGSRVVPDGKGGTR